MGGIPAVFAVTTMFLVILEVTFEFFSVLVGVIAYVRWVSVPFPCLRLCYQLPRNLAPERYS
jgi:hypothetical protein